MAQGHQASIYPRGKQAVSVSVGSGDNPVVSIKIVKNSTIYTLADGTVIVAGAVVSTESTNVNTSELKAKMITYAIIMGED